MQMQRMPQVTPARPGDPGNFTKPPRAPDRPLVPYMRFSRKMWAKVRADNPDAQLWDIGKIIGQLWKDLPEVEKAVYNHEYEMEKNEYEKQMKNYYASHAYQNYQQTKARSGAGAALLNNRDKGRGRGDVGGVVIQPVDEDEAMELSGRRLAAVRFDRNHRLIADLFSPAVVTDSRTIVAQNRIEMLRKQAQSLSTHQQKLEEELKRLEESFVAKKRAIEAASDEFSAKLKRECDKKPQIDEQRFVELVEEWTGKLAEAYVEYQKKQDEINAKQAAEREKLADKTPVLYSLTMDSPKPSNEGEEKNDDEEKEEGQEGMDTSESTEAEAAAEEANEKEEAEADDKKKKTPKKKAKTDAKDKSESNTPEA